MPDALLPGKERTARIIIYRTGKQVDIKRPDGTETENKYGKVSDSGVTYQVVDTGRARRGYPNSETEANEGGVEGGRIDTESPRILMPKNTAAEEDDRLSFPDGTTYVLDERVHRDTYAEFRSKLIT